MRRVAAPDAQGGQRRRAASSRRPCCPGAYPELGSLDDVIGHLDTLRAADLVNLDRAADQAYLFKHVATQEVAYESLPFAVRSMLHGRVGAVPRDRPSPDGVDRHLDLLAHHFWLSDDDDRKRDLPRGARPTRPGLPTRMPRRSATSSDWSPLLDGADRADALLKLGKVLELSGDWTRAEQVDREALAIGTELDDAATRGWSRAALAEVARKQGRYDEAVEHLDAARSRFEEVGDEDGLGQVLHLAGTVAAQRGDYDTAQAQYEASLAIRERLGDKASMGGLFSNLGVIADVPRRLRRVATPQ